MPLHVILIAMLLGPACSPPPATQDGTATAPAPAPARKPTGLTDGPHLFHRPGGSVEAVWVEDGKRRSRTFTRGKPIVLPLFARSIGKELTLPVRHDPGPPILKAPAKMLVVSDAEGEYDVLVRLLRANGVIDSEERWAWGEGHLVCVGDMVDRGDKVTELLWLCYRLEREARAAGGRLHYVLGNHEAMIMGNDLRYIAPKYREVTRILGITYDRLVGADSEIGRWLRSKHSLMRIGEWIFVHGGIAPEAPVTEKNLAEINQRMRNVLGIDPLEVKPTIDRLGWTFAWSRRGPYWYRGYFPEIVAVDPDFGPVPKQKDIDAIVKRLGGETIVIGHTKVPRPTFKYRGAVLALDTPWTNVPGIRGMLIDEKGRFFVDVDGRRTAFKKPKKP